MILAFKTIVIKQFISSTVLINHFAHSAALNPESLKVSHGSIISPVYGYDSGQSLLGKSLPALFHIKHRKKKVGLYKIFVKCKAFPELQYSQVKIPGLGMFICLIECNI